MQWNADPNAGFSSSSSSWLPINKNHLEINVAKQDKDPNSHLGIYRRLSIIRQCQTVLHGSLEVMAKDGIFAFTRILKDKPSYLIAVNMNDTDITVEMTKMLRGVPSTGITKVTSSGNASR